MGKVLIIKGADFSKVAVGNIEPVPTPPGPTPPGPTPLVIDLGTLTNAYMATNGAITPITDLSSSDSWKISDFVSIPSGMTKITGTYDHPHENQVGAKNIAYIAFYNDSKSSIVSNYRAQVSGTIDTINATVPSGATYFRMCFRFGYNEYSKDTCYMPELKFK